MEIVLNNPNLVKYDFMEKDAIFLLSLEYPMTRDGIDFLLREEFIVLNGVYQLTDKGREAINTFKNTKVKSKVEKPSLDVTVLATTLRELFPEGRKGETPYYWRGSQAEIEKKLLLFKTKYPAVSNEDILQATKNYISAFGGNRTYMQLLKYFIEKDGNSTLLSYVENIKNHKVVDKEDWTVGIK